MDVIQAAGAVLWRRLSDELIQVALIHRPRYDDWSFPKGKLNQANLKSVAPFVKF
jgi:8-oxo-dGTP pyrophosphatase MutT (NUDIX family)